MAVILRFTDGSTTTFLDQFDSEEAFWKVYRHAIALENPFVFIETNNVKHYFNFKQIVSVIFSKPDTAGHNEGTSSSTL